MCTTDSAHRHPVALNTLDRKFEPTQPDCTWAGEITYVWKGKGWLYLAVLLDLFSCKAVSWAMSERIDHELVLCAVDMALFSTAPLESRQPVRQRGLPNRTNLNDCRLPPTWWSSGEAKTDNRLLDGDPTAELIEFRQRDQTLAVVPEPLHLRVS